jgi:hypothetical protein
MKLMPIHTDAQLHVALADLARTMHSKTTQGPDAVLEEITARAVEVIDGVMSAGITLTKRKKVVDSVAPTDDTAAQFDMLQREADQGPCLDAAWTGHTIRVDDLMSDDRWPKLVRAAREHSPVRSSVSFQLFTHAEGMGALNLYSDHPHGITPEAQEVGYALAAHAALVFDASRRQHQFDSALASRDIIGQAKGMIMERFSIDATQAFDLLTKLSQDSNVPVVEISRQLVASSTDNSQ